MLTIHEVLVCDDKLDTDDRDLAFAEARELLCSMYTMPDDLMGRAEVDRMLADAKLQLLKKLTCTSTKRKSANSPASSVSACRN